MSRRLHEARPKEGTGQRPWRAPEAPERGTAPHYATKPHRNMQSTNTMSGVPQRRQEQQGPCHHITMAGLGCDVPAVLLGELGRVEPRRVQGNLVRSHREVTSEGAPAVSAAST